jgi:Xaa-Pro dipeptidase
LTISYEHEGGEFDEAKLTTALYLPEVEAAEVMYVHLDPTAARRWSRVDSRWCGLPPSPAEIAKALTFSSITEGWTPVTLFPANSALPTYIHTLPTTRSPTAQVARINGPKHTTTYLIKALHEARRNKTEQEMVWMREASRITSGAHTELMRKMGKGEAKDEAEAESIFVAYCRKEGAKYQAYTPIVAAGAHAGTLHYVANDGPFPTTAPGSLLLVDAGGEFKNYAGDVTRCIPVRPSAALAASFHTHV